ncbi:MAG: hypothetical protein WBP82_05690 [Leuconostoc mesenteroides]
MANTRDDELFAAGYQQAIYDLKNWTDVAENTFKEDSDVMQTAQGLILYLEGALELRKELKTKQNDQ